MNFSVTTSSALSQKQPAAVLFAFEKQRLDGPAAFKNLLRHVGPKEFRGAERQIFLLHSAGKLAPQRILLVGLGKRDKFTTEPCAAPWDRRQKTPDLGVERAAVQVAGDVGDSLGAIVEAAILATYQFRQFKPDDDGDATELKTLTLCLPAYADLKAARKAAADAQIVAEATNYAREIGNLPATSLRPKSWQTTPANWQTIRVWCAPCSPKKELEAGGFGGLLAVGGGSANEPHLIVLEYCGSKDATPIALVGKAITFDSGGISIKPSDKMDEMKFDKCGGVAVLAIMKAIAQLKLPLNLIGVISSAENMPGSTSYRPGDIVTSYRGADKRAVTIEVLNTDAEGRIVLGDALAYARERGAKTIIDFATLTGACVVALGSIAAGLLGNDDALQEKFARRLIALATGSGRCRCGRSTRTRSKATWPTSRIPGAATAAPSRRRRFLAKYVGDTPWAHLDIAGHGLDHGRASYLTKGATGFGVRLVVDLLRRWN